MTLQRFKIGMFNFIRRPVSSPPPEGVICFADNGHESGWSDRTVAVFADGVWTSRKGKPLPFEPTYWIDFGRLQK